MRQRATGEENGAGSAPYHPGRPVAAGGAGGVRSRREPGPDVPCVDDPCVVGPGARGLMQVLFRRRGRALPVLLTLVALLAMPLAVETGAWRGMAVAGGASPKAAPMPAQDAGSTAERTGPPATPEVRGAVAGPTRDEAGTDTGVRPAPNAADKLKEQGGQVGQAGQAGRQEAAGDGSDARAQGAATVPDMPDMPGKADGSGGAAAPDTVADAAGDDAAGKDDGGEVAGKATVGAPDATLVAQAEQPPARQGQPSQPVGQGQPSRPGPATQTGQAVQSGQTAEPGRAAPAPARPTGIRLFNTIEFRGPLKNLPKWDRVLNVDRKTPGLTPERALGGRNALWGELRSEWRGLSTMDKLRNVNSLFNQWPYRLDSEVWGVVDYWAAPIEFLRKSGDCEDYAITKYFALKQLGVPVSDMRIVILLDSIRRLAHAILVVYTGGDAYVLDNLSNVVLSHQRYGHYVPQYSINEEYRWAHIPIKGGPGTRRMQ